MNMIFDLLDQSSAWLVKYNTELASAFVLTILAIYGDDINKVVRQKVRGKNWFIRTGSFIALCAFGYGFLTVLFVSYLTQGISALPQRYLGLISLGAFLFLGWLASRKGQI